MRQRGNPFEGSNPSPAANKDEVAEQMKILFCERREGILIEAARSRPRSKVEEASSRVGNEGVR